MLEFGYHMSLCDACDFITNGHLLICGWCFGILKGSKMRSLDSDKDVVKSEV